MRSGPDVANKSVHGGGDLGNNSFERATTMMIWPTQEEELLTILNELEEEGWEALGGHPMGSNLIAQVLDLFFGVLNPWKTQGTAKDGGPHECSQETTCC